MLDIKAFDVKVAKLIQRQVGSRLSQNNGVGNIVIEGLNKNNRVPPLPYISLKLLDSFDSNSFITNSYYNTNDEKVYETVKDLVYVITVYGDSSDAAQTLHLLKKSVRYDSSSEYITANMDATIQETTNVIPILDVLSDRRNYKYEMNITFSVMDVDIDTNSLPLITSVDTPIITLTET